MDAHSKTLKIAKFAVLGLALVAGGAFATYKAYAGQQEGFIPNGVRVAGMDWSNKPTATARAELQGWQQAKVAETLKLTATLPSGRTKSWTPTRTDLGAAVDLDGTLQEAEKARAGESPMTRISDMFGSQKPVDIAPKWTLDEAVTNKYLTRQVVPAVLRNAKDARFLASSDSFKVQPEEPGVKLDLAEALNRIRTALGASSVDEVQLPLVTAAPRVTSKDLQGIEGEIGRFQTHYGETGNRRRNIENACSRINGVVLKPGDIFSYNKIVGPREESNGFRMAPVIIKGKLEPGLGGGVCQTSSTLYNAILLAGLKVVRRTHHAFPVHYLPAGRDATVAYGSIDFQFQNDTDAPVAVAADGTGGRVLMRVFGKKTPGREIRIERTNVSSFDAPTQIVTDRTLKPGKRSTVDSGHDGHRVKVWRIMKLNGQVVKRELLSSDHYDAFPRVVAVGPVASPKSRNSAAGQAPGMSAPPVTTPVPPPGH